MQGAARRTGVAAYEKIQQIADDWVGDDDEEVGDYEIITAGNYKITRDELHVQKSVRIMSRGSSIDCDDAWEKLGDFLDQLDSEGRLELAG